MEYQNENFNGEYDFRSRFHDGYRINVHLHEYSELLYCKSGCGVVTVNGTEILLKEKEMVWIPPNYIHQYEFSTAQVICAVFSNDFIPLFFKKLDRRYLCVSALNVEKHIEILERFPKLTKEDDSLLISGYLNLICADVLAQSEFGETRHADGELYQKVISYMSEHFTEKLLLSDLAREFGYNTKYLSHSLHELTGIHFTQLMNFYRINQAKKFLTSNTHKNISEIAINCGFNSLNTFNREFKRMVVMTPSEYGRR